MNQVQEYITKIENSFRASNKGEEKINIVLYYWGLISYAFFYLVVNQLILAVNNKVFDIVLSSIGMIYFLWHLFAIMKNKPKKPKLSKEEKKRLRAEYWHNAPKSFMRKLLLQEPLSKWNPVAMEVAVDLLFLVHYFGYITY